MTEPRRTPDEPKRETLENVVTFRRRRAGPSTSEPAPGDDADQDQHRDRANVAVLVLAAMLVFLGWLLVHELGKSAHLQDCLASGRADCAPIEPPAGE